MLPVEIVRKAAQRVLGPAALDTIGQEALEPTLKLALAALRMSEIRYRGLADLIPAQVWTAAPDGQLDYVNARVCAYFGQSEERFLGNGWLTVLHPDDVESSISAWSHALTTGEPYEMEFRLRRADGVYQPHVGRAFPLRADDGAIVRWVGTNSNVADERELRRLAAIIESSEDAIIGTTLDGTVTDWNLGAERLYGYGRDDMLGRDVAMLAPPAHREEVAGGVRRIAQGALVESLDTQRVTSSGRVVEVSLNVSPIRDETGEVVGVSTIERDITERKRMERELAHRALHDTLTGLPNRALLMDRLEGALARRRRDEGVVGALFVDLDDFKLINDSLGHSTGDALLRAVAPRLSALVRRGDTVARFGGDEFVVLCESLAEPRDALLLAQRIVAAMEEPFALDGARHVVTATVGIAIADSASDPETLLSNADAAMYRAKAAGRSRYEVFDESVRVQVVERLALEARLRHALAADELHLHFQPIVRLTDSAITGFEALLRWQPCDGPPVAPGEFIPVAEQAGLIVPIGDFVLRTACRQAVQWHQHNPDLRMSINVSAVQVADPDFADCVRRVIDETGVDPRSLCLEITESALMEDPPRAVKMLGALRGVGAQIALDDFGTGYSSLSHLKRFPLDAVKIDRDFVGEVGADPRDAAIVDTIVRLARTLGLRAVGEGVETVEQAEALLGLGCDEAQGFLFARPLPPDEATRLLPR